MNKRRQLLKMFTIAPAMSFTGCSEIAPFFAQWSPNENAKLIGGPTIVDIKNIESNVVMESSWRGSPILIFKRNTEQINQLKNTKYQSLLKDPKSINSKQPLGLSSTMRSLTDELFVVAGVCTYLGCKPTYKESLSIDNTEKVPGFFCPCHGSQYDLSGRVFKDSPSDRNLDIPPYTIENYVLTIG